MTHLTRRGTLLGGAALGALGACGGAASPPQNTPTSTPQPPEPAMPTSAPNTPFVDGTEIAAMIARGETTSLEQTEIAIARSKSVNDELNFIATEAYDSALKAAETPAPGAFSGVPTFMKDLIDWSGIQTLWGSQAFRGYIPETDSPLSADWRKGGVVVLGKSTSPEMGLISSTEPVVTGPTRNPWDASRIPGGSSGGAASLVAARVVPFAHASDGGGSIRIPAACCGLFGLKPSAGRMTGRAGAPPPVEISVNHAVTLTVRDSINLFRLADTRGAYDPIGELTATPKKLRIGYAPDSATGSPIDAATRAGVESAAQLCRDLGHEVVDFSMAFDAEQFSDQFLLLWAAGAAEFAQDASRFTGKPPSPEILEPWTLGLAQMFLQRRDDLPGAIAYLTGFKQTYHSMFDTIDLILSPTVGSVAPPIGEQAPTVDYDTLMERVLNFAAFTSPMNVSGAASMSVPLAWSDEGLPVGVMFSGKQGDDALLFELALQLEEARPWIDRLPPIRAK